MEFFRNPEIKKSSLLFAVITVAATVAGFTRDLLSGFFVLFLCLIFTGLYFIFTLQRYRKIAELSRSIDQILHGNAVLPIDAYYEGELAILASEIQKMTTRLREQADILRRDKQYLADSLANISHQIRTPLTSINLILSFFQDETLPEERRIALTHQILRLLSHIEWLIATLLKISRLDTGAVKFQNENILISSLLQKAIEPIAVALDLRNQKIHLQIQEDAAFQGDPEWTQEAVLNILKNCMEHTPFGGNIHVLATENAVFTEIKIKDSGEGIAPEDLPHVFERFYRGKRTTDKNVGIGLALTSMIVTGQNGTIKAENGKDGGAVFTIRFYKSIV